MLLLLNVRTWRRMLMKTDSDLVPAAAGGGGRQGMKE